jgi:hypothetical protein
MKKLHIKIYSFSHNIEYINLLKPSANFPYNQV